MKSRQKATSPIRMQPSIGTPNIKTAAQVLAPLIIAAHERHFHYDQFTYRLSSGRVRVRIDPRLATIGG